MEYKLSKELIKLANQVAEIFSRADHKELDRAMRKNNMAGIYKSLGITKEYAEELYRKTRVAVGCTPD